MAASHSYALTDPAALSDLILVRRDREDAGKDDGWPLTAGNSTTVTASRPASDSRAATPIRYTDTRMPTNSHATHRDDIAYIAPMAAFLLLTGAGGQWPRFFVASYILKTFLTGALLIWFRNNYTQISWKWALLGIGLGILGIVQWCGIEELLGGDKPIYPKIPGSSAAMIPFEYFKGHPFACWAFIIIRWAGATLVVPFMEELFWRDYLWRTVVAPNNFKLAKVGEWDLQAFIIVTLCFTSVHPQWITALIWGAGIGGLLVWKRSLGACIVMHAVTNFLLGAYTLYTGKWYYW
ncbi:MAG: CAAX prenyl protease-related protein [Tepidisphaeraceae bacterium]|jgi:hypothetical protein